MAKLHGSFWIGRVVRGAKRIREADRAFTPNASDRSGVALGHGYTRDPPVFRRDLDELHPDRLGVCLQDPAYGLRELRDELLLLLLGTTLDHVHLQERHVENVTPEVLPLPLSEPLRIWP